LKSPAEYHIEAIQKISDMAMKSYEEENKILITLSFGAVGFIAHQLLNSGYNFWLVVSFISFSICLIMLVIYYAVMRKNAIKAIKNMPTEALTFNADEFGAEIGARLNNLVTNVMQNPECYEDETEAISQYINKSFDKFTPPKTSWFTFFKAYLWQFTKYASFIIGTVCAVIYVLVSI